MAKTKHEVQLHTSLYQIDTSDIDHNVAHLFEHLVIAGFRKEAVKHHLHPTLIGWISGESFKERLFVTAGFYQSQVDRLFHYYMTHLPRFDKIAIKHQVSILEAEDKVSLTPSSWQQLTEYLDQLSTRDWNDTFGPPSSHDQPIIINEQKKASLFRTVTADLCVDVNLLTLEEQFVFLRVYVLMADAVHAFIQDVYSAYQNDSTDIMIRDDKLGFALDYTIRRGVTTIKRLDQEITKHLHDFPIDKYIDQIQAHFQTYSKNCSWRDFPIDYFRETGLSPTPQMITELATRERIASLFRRVQVKVVAND